MFAFFMAIGRTLLGIMGNKMNVQKILTASAILSSVCYLAIAFLPSPMLSLAACALSGFAVSIMWPATLDLAASAFVCGTSAFSLLSLAGDIGCTLGPSVNGFVSDLITDTSLTGSFAKILKISPDQAAIRLGFAVTALFSVIMIFALIRISRVFFAKNKLTRSEEPK
jgi:MFS family permease